MCSVYVRYLTPSLSSTQHFKRFPLRYIELIWLDGNYAFCAKHFAPSAPNNGNRAHAYLNTAKIHSAEIKMNCSIRRHTMYGANTMAKRLVATFVEIRVCVESEKRFCFLQIHLRRAISKRIFVQKTLKTSFTVSSYVSAKNNIKSKHRNLFDK